MVWQEFKSFYEKWMLVADIIIPIIVGILIIYVGNGISLFNSNDEDFIKLLIYTIFPTIATIGVTLLGFIITGVSVLISFTESGKLPLLKQSVHYKTLFDVYFHAIKFLAILSIVSLCGIFAPKSFTIEFFYVLIVLVMISIWQTYRCVWALEQIISLSK
jgi:hypothetical protein